MLFPSSLWGTLGNPRDRLCNDICFGLIKPVVLLLLSACFYDLILSQIIVSCSCHALLQDTAILSSVIPFMFAVFVPWMPEEETGFFLVIKITSGTQGNANVCLGGNVDVLCSHVSFLYLLLRFLKAAWSASSRLFSRIESRKCEVKCTLLMLKCFEGCNLKLCCDAFCLWVYFFKTPMLINDQPALSIVDCGVRYPYKLLIVLCSWLN